MPLTVRKFKAKVRDSQTGNMIPAGLLSSDALEAIEDAKDSALDEIDDQVDIATDAAAAAQESAQSAASAVLTGNLAPQYSGTATYEIGDHVLQNGTLYRCNTTISSPQSTFVAAHWTQVMVGPQVDDIIKINQPADDGTKIRVVTSDEDVDLVTVEDLQGYVPAPQEGGEGGQILATDGEDGTYWTSVGTPDYETTQRAVNTWMESHSGQYIIPDGNVTTAKIADSAVTTGKIADEAITQDKLDDDAVVQGKIADGAVTQDKLDDELKLKVIKDYVTPQMFGAKGDGTTDDTAAITSMFASNVGRYLFNGTYAISSQINAKGYIFGKGKIISKNSARISEGFFNIIGNIELEGITFDCACSTAYQPSDYPNLYNTALIFKQNTFDIKINNCIFLNCYTNFLYCYQVGGYLSIKNSRFEGKNGNRSICGAISLTTLGGTENVDILNNVFIGNGDQHDNMQGIFLSGLTTRKNICIEGNRFIGVGRDNTGSHRLCAIDCYFNVDNIDIKNNQFVDNGYSCIRCHGGHNINIVGNYFGEHHNITMEPCVVLTDDPGGGVLVGMENVYIGENVFATTTRCITAIQLTSGSSSSQGQIKNVSICNNKINGYYSYSILADGSVRGLLISNNEIDYLSGNFQGGPIHLDGRNYLFTTNSEITIKDNYIRLPNGHCVNAETSVGDLKLKIYNNILESITNYAVTLQESITHSEVKNNIINSKYGVRYVGLVSGNDMTLENSSYALVSCGQQYNNYVNKQIYTT